MVEKPGRVPWPKTTRRLAAQIAAEHEAGAAETARRLRAEHGVDVPVTTLRHWLTAAQPESLSGAGDVVSVLTDRALALASRELASLERTPKGKVDLSRLASLAQILRSLNGLRPKEDRKPKLDDLAKLDAATSAENLEAFDVTDAVSEAAAYG